jgi:Ca2+-binding EF-hand superfamily protein
MPAPPRKAPPGTKRVSSPRTKSGSRFAVPEIKRVPGDSVQAMIRAALKHHGARLSDLVREWDTDRNGEVSRAEFRNGLKALGVEGENAEFDALFDAWDSDGGGSLDFMELEKALRANDSLKDAMQAKLAAANLEANKAPRNQGYVFMSNAAIRQQRAKERSTEELALKERLLVEERAQLKLAELGEALRTASASGDLQEVQRILASTTKERTRQRSGQERPSGEGEPLAAASVSTKELLEHSNHEGVTALIKAAMYGREGVVRTLLHAGALVDATDQRRRTALMLGALNGRVEVLKLLLEAGASVELADGKGRTALMHAAEHGHAEAVTLLAATCKKRAIMRAMRTVEGDSIEEVVAARRAAGSIVGAPWLAERDESGCTALDLAKGAEQAAAIKVLKALEAEAAQQLAEAEARSADEAEEKARRKAAAAEKAAAEKAAAEQAAAEKAAAKKAAAHQAAAHQAAADQAAAEKAAAEQASASAAAVSSRAAEMDGAQQLKREKSASKWANLREMRRSSSGMVSGSAEAPMAGDADVGMRADRKGDGAGRAGPTGWAGELMRTMGARQGKFITGFLASFGFSKESGLRPSMSHTEAFSVLDQDGSGTISASELKSALMKGGSSQVSEAEIQSLISQVDANGDGELQLDEFEVLWKRWQATARGGKHVAQVPPLGISASAAENNVAHRASSPTMAVCFAPDAPEPSSVARHGDASPNCSPDVSFKSEGSFSSFKKDGSLSRSSFRRGVALTTTWAKALLRNSNEAVESAASFVRGRGPSSFKGPASPSAAVASESGSFIGSVLFAAGMTPAAPVARPMSVLGEVFARDERDRAARDAAMAGDPMLLA